MAKSPKTKNKRLPVMVNPAPGATNDDLDVALDGNQDVTIDHGDLSEIHQAAEAWAAFLRQRAESVRKEFGALPIAVEDAERYNAAADRIDQAISRTRRDAQASATVGAK